MRRIHHLFLALATITPFLTSAPADDASTRILIAYYSRTGTTKAVAEAIHARTGGVLLEIIPETPYPDDYRTTTAQAKNEMEINHLPPLKSIAPDWERHDIIFIGSPIWWGTLSRPVVSFLSGHDLAGKTLIPFSTHGGGGPARYESDMLALQPAAKLQPGISFYGRDNQMENDIAVWLEKLNIQPENKQ